MLPEQSTTFSFVLVQPIFGSLWALFLVICTQYSLEETKQVLNSWANHPRCIIIFHIFGVTFAQFAVMAEEVGELLEEWGLQPLIKAFSGKLLLNTITMASIDVNKLV